MTSPHCSYCGDLFVRNKYSTRQRACSKPSCRKARQLESMRLWRQKNPDYFKQYADDPNMRELNIERCRAWRQSNPDYYKSYRTKNIDKYRNYMREYMRNYRANKGLPTTPSP